jgi:DMSO/TMAO reductase YedYZ heme-binding membrane subunit
VNQVWWIAARSSGIVAWALLAASMMWGLTLSTKVFRRAALVPGFAGRPRPNWQLDLHRFLGGAAVVFVAIHLTAIIADSYVDFGVVDVLVPFAAGWHPGAVAWGIVALYLLLAVEITSLLRRHLSTRTWRALHYLSFPLFVVATIHLLSAGTDSQSAVLRTTVLVASSAVMALLTIRIVQADRASRTTTPQPAPDKESPWNPPHRSLHPGGNWLPRPSPTPPLWDRPARPADQPRVLTESGGGRTPPGGRGASPAP